MKKIKRARRYERNASINEISMYGYWETTTINLGNEKFQVSKNPVVEISSRLVIAKEKIRNWKGHWGFLPGTGQRETRDNKKCERASTYIYKEFQKMRMKGMLEKQFGRGNS